MVAIAIQPARADDFAEILTLLTRSGLPPEGLSDHLATTLVARKGRKIIGSAALELYGPAALLRSVAVEQGMRGQGLGQQLTRAALDLARQHGAETIYLLTETASAFFARLGFRPISRSEVVPIVRRSVEFTTLCPESAQVMIAEMKEENHDSQKDR